MGLYLNPGNEEFRNAAIHSKIYVDKTEMIKFTNSQCSRSKFLTKLLKTFDKTFREIFPVFISTKRREKPSAFLTIIL